MKACLLSLCHLLLYSLSCSAQPSAACCELIDYIYKSLTNFSVFPDLRPLPHVQTHLVLIEVLNEDLNRHVGQVLIVLHAPAEVVMLLPGVLCLPSHGLIDQGTIVPEVCLLL
jgi:hypothetical protein